MLNTLLRFTLALCLVTSFQSCKDDEVDINNTEDFEDFIQDEMDFQGIPAVSVLIFKEDRTLYETYFGKSTIATDTYLEQDHMFLLASISKVITATALLQLHDDGAFALDDAINDYLPFEVSAPNQSTPITFRMLLTHTSGIADGSALDGQYYNGQDSPVALDYFLENYLVPGGEFYNASENYHDFEPGTQHEYSNEGSALIAVLVEQIAEQGFNDYCKENIFQPLGMENTFWRLDEAIASGHPLVQPYFVDGDGFGVIEHYTFTDYPNGGLRSTGRDLHKFLNAFTGAGISNGHRLLEEATINAMITPQISSIDGEVGLHMFVMNAEHGLWGHDGGEDGVATIMAFHPTTNVGAIILANEGDADLDQMLSEAYKLGLEL